MQTKIDRSGWVAKIRETETFGKGSCSTVDECMSDSELTEFLADFETFDEAWGMLCDIEETHWDRCGIAWECPKEVV